MNILSSKEETKELGKYLGNTLKEGDILLLEGDLGTGKTTFTQGLAEGLGIKEYVNSPTFVIINEYFDGRLPLYHMDLYRIEEEQQLFDIGVEEFLFGNGVCVIEWPSIALELLPDEYISFLFSYNGTQRTISMDVHGEFKELEDCFNEYFSH